MFMKCAIVIVGELLLEEPLGPDFIRLDQSCVQAPELLHQRHHMPFKAHESD